MNVPFVPVGLTLSSDKLLEEVMFLRQQLCEERAIRTESVWHDAQSSYRSSLVSRKLETLEEALAVAEAELRESSNARCKLSEALSRNGELENTNRLLLSELQGCRAVFDDASERLSSIERSMSYRIGRIITAPIRFLR